MINTREQQVTTKIKEVTTIDPRIDSPDVKVIYPSPIEELKKEILQEGKSDTIIEETQPIVEPQNQTTKKEEEQHVCKVDTQEAVKQNLLGFIVLVILSLGIGYLIGKK